MTDGDALTVGRLAVEVNAQRRILVRCSHALLLLGKAGTASGAKSYRECY